MKTYVLFYNEIWILIAHCFEVMEIKKFQSSILGRASPLCEFMSVNMTGDLMLQRCY